MLDRDTPRRESFLQAPWVLLASFFLVGSISVRALYSAEGETTPAERELEGTRQLDESLLEVLKQHCTKCHQSETRKAGLNLATPEGILKGSESGPIVEPGKPDQSLLFEMVRDGLMPPDGEDPLTAEDTDLIRRWIGTGARFSAESETPEVTQHDVLPILYVRCTVCHGRRKQEGGLDLRTKASMLRGGKSGPTFVPGKPAESLMLRRIAAEEMPPRRRLVEVSIKTMPGSEQEIIKQWIASGAPEIAAAPEAPGDADPLVSEVDRKFWAFQPPRDVPVPRVHNAARVRNPIDAFVLARLESKGLTLAPETDRRRLMRRVSLDLIGLPPQPEEIDAFLTDPSPGAYEAMIDRLLASPRYGERWARHWLDVAGYADSEGVQHTELLRPYAYRYRDYVIRAFNDDKPYDRFLLEQLAGDELADYEGADEITPELYDNLVATGFLRMVPDGTWANITAFVPDRLDVIADAIEVVGSGVMGLTLGCARCHSHKFDPIPQRDYYRLAALLKGAYDEHDWVKPNFGDSRDYDPDRPAFRHLRFVTNQERELWQRHEDALKRKIDSLENARSEVVARTKQSVVDARLAELPDEIRDDVRRALATDAEQRDEIATYLADKFEAALMVDEEELKIQDEVFRKRVDAIDQEVASLESQRQRPPLIRALWDRGEPSPTYVLRRGNYLTPGEPVSAAPPAVLMNKGESFPIQPPWPEAQKTGRRLAFARWLTKPDHPLTARVMVNRIWKHHFRHGLVKSLGNFGRSGTPPTHPQLLDWLAREFVRSGWSMKHLHRLIVTSSTYRQSSAHRPDSDRIDPDGDLLSRYPLKRMEAEVLRDTLLRVAGRLDENPFGPADAVNVRDDGLATSQATAKGRRRGIYVELRRKQIPTLFENFDFPEMSPNCLERPVSTVVPQALHLMNNAMIRGLSRHLAERVAEEAGGDLAAQVTRLYLIALGRPPSSEERSITLDTLNQLTHHWSTQPRKPDDEPSAPGTLALTNVCHALINSSEFIYID